jgi:hypothetical protein
VQITNNLPFWGINIAFQAVNERIKTLREQADIEVDTDLFDELYEQERSKAEQRQ